MKQTAVKWLIDQMKKYNITVSVHTTSHENVSDFYSAIELAKQMEKEQICDAWYNSLTKGNFNSALEYYNETFKTE